MLSDNLLAVFEESLSMFDRRNNRLKTAPFVFFQDTTHGIEGARRFFRVSYSEAVKMLNKQEMAVASVGPDGITLHDIFRPRRDEPAKYRVTPHSVIVRLYHSKVRGGNVPVIGALSSIGDDPLLLNQGAVDMTYDSGMGPDHTPKHLIESVAGVYRTAEETFSCRITDPTFGTAFRLSVDPQDILRIFAERDKDPSANRRKALMHIVSAHTRRQPTKQEYINIQQHLRGSRQCRWKGLDIFFTGPDLEDYERHMDKLALLDWYDGELQKEAALTEEAEICGALGIPLPEDMSKEL